MSVLFGSITSSIMQDGGLGDSFTAWLFYTSLVLMACSLISQTHLLNRAMELGDTTAVFPVFEAFWISFGVIGGLIFYNTSDISWGDDFKQGAGCIFMLIGCGFLLLHQETMRENVLKFETRMRRMSVDIGSRARSLSENVYDALTPRGS